MDIDIIKYRKRKLIIIFLLIMTFIEIGLSIFYFYIDNNIAGFLCLISSIVYGSICFINFKYKNLTFHYEIVIISIYSILIIGSFLQNTKGFTPLWLITLPGITFFFVGLKKGLFYNISSLVFLITIFYILPFIHENSDILDGLFVYAHQYDSVQKERVIALMVLSIIINYIVALFNSILEEDLRSKANKLQKLAHYDVLTGARNRSSFDEVLNQFLSQIKKHKFPLSLIIIDVDRFKEINDTFGHNMGDQMLIEISHKCCEVLTSKNPFFRWGGEEFLAILPNNNLEDAYQIAEKIRLTIKDIRLISPSGDYASVTLSLGVHQFDHNNLFIKEFAIVDKCLYKAKEDKDKTVKSSDIMSIN